MEIKDYESELRTLVAAAERQDYISYKTLKEAQTVHNCYVIMEGDYGGQIYLTCPAELVTCSEDELKSLLDYIDSLCWRDDEGKGLYYEPFTLGSFVPGGMGGGLAEENLWLHEELLDKGLEKHIRKVLFGNDERV